MYPIPGEVRLCAVEECSPLSRRYRSTGPVGRMRLSAGPASTEIPAHLEDRHWQCQRADLVYAVETWDSAWHMGQLVG